VIPHDLEKYFNEISFAYWIMDDGGLNVWGVLLINTHSYSLAEVKYLSDMLNAKFLISSTVQKKREGQWNIRIAKRDLPKVRLLVSEYMHPSMLYKIKEVNFKDTRKNRVRNKK